MRIAVDARELLRPDRTGVERMLYEFIAHIDDIDGAARPAAGAPAIEWLLLFDRNAPLVEELARRHTVRVIAPRHPRLQSLFDAWTAWQVGPALRAAGIDLFYSPNTKFPLFGGVPAVITVHGVEWHFHPQGYRRVERMRQRLWFELGMRRAAGIVTFAQHTRVDIDRVGSRRAGAANATHAACAARAARKSPAAPQAPRDDTSHPWRTPPVHVTGEGVAGVFRRLLPGELDTGVPARLGIDGPYILAVSSLVPRKNVAGLLHALALLAAEGLPHRLALVGKSGWRAGALHDLTRRLGLGSRVTFTGYIDDATLVQLYNQAALFAYPSFYEGFGLPLLEAMACGAPVVTAAASATAEVAGDAAVLCDPADPRSIARALMRVLSDPLLAATLRERGAVRLARYDWARMTRSIAGFLADRAGLPDMSTPGYARPATSAAFPTDPA